MNDQTKSDSVEKIARLLHCPFCGGDAERFRIDDEGHDDYGGQGVQCKDCGCSTNLTFACGDDPSEVISEKWNSRVCSHCGGSGELLKRFDGGFDSDSCPVCGGSGTPRRAIPPSATAQEPVGWLYWQRIPLGGGHFSHTQTFSRTKPQNIEKPQPLYAAPPPQPVSEAACGSSASDNAICSSRARSGEPQQPVSETAAQGSVEFEKVLNEALDAEYKGATYEDGAAVVAAYKRRNEARAEVLRLYALAAGRKS